MKTKMVLLLFAISLLAASVTNAADRWDGDDKMYHEVVGTFLGLGGYAFADIAEQKQPERNKVLFGIGVATFVGTGKELYDMTQPGNHFCGKDLAVTIAGGIAGSFLGTSITYTDHTVFASRTWRW